jgi:tRNA(Arg) A34 adenosine deaminase TadA
MDCTVTDEKWASRAINEAKKSHLLMKHGCLATSGGKLIAAGCNTYQTYSKDGFIKNSCSCHAEINVLRKLLKLNYIDSKINLYIVRISNDNEFRDSCPCNECLQIIKLFNIKYLIYSTKCGLKKCKASELNTSYLSSGQKAILENRISCFVSN